MNMIIKFGVAGRMRTGKTTVAQYLQRRYGFCLSAFANPIKDFALLVGWDGAKDERGRTLLQDIGTVVRKYNAEFWIEKMLADLPQNRCVAVDDMRMLLEDRRLSEAGFKTIMVVRDPALIHDAPAATTDHVTEREVDAIAPWRTLYNNGSLDELYAQVDTVVAELNRNVA
jgi:hypothetical protein